VTPYFDNDSAFWAYYQWAENQLSRWEEEQYLAEQEEKEEFYENSDWFNDPNNVMSHHHY
jgi:hypothetical protein